MFTTDFTGVPRSYRCVLGGNSDGNLTGSATARTGLERPFVPFDHDVRIYFREWLVMAQITILQKCIHHLIFKAVNSQSWPENSRRTQISG
jgi:hypothetical protein